MTGRFFLPGYALDAFEIARQQNGSRDSRHLTAHTQIVDPSDLSRFVELGVIAGDKSLGVGRLLARLPRPNDGTVALDETPLEGMQDYLVLNTNHMGLMLSREATDAVISFLHSGRFPASSRALLNH